MTNGFYKLTAVALDVITPIYSSHLTESYELILIFTNNSKLIFLFQIKFVLLQSHLPAEGDSARRTACEAEHYIFEGVIALCFWTIELPQSRSKQEHCRGKCHGV